MEEDRQLQEELEYWQELETLLGWKLYGWTFKNSASYDTGGLYHSSVTLTGKQRDDIVRAIKNAEATAKNS